MSILLILDYGFGHQCIFTVSIWEDALKFLAKVDTPERTIIRKVVNF